MTGTGQPADTLNPEPSEVITGSNLVGVQPDDEISGSGPREFDLTADETTSSSVTVCVVESLKERVTVPG